MSVYVEFYSLFIFFIILNFTSCVVKKFEKLESLEHCGGEYSGYQYTIVSPNYPNYYSENENCIYILRGSSEAKCNQMFHLTFLNFTLRHSYECQKDYLEIGDKSVFCGNVMGVRNFLSKNNTLKLRFHSDENSNDRGFKILVTTLPCPNVVAAINESKKNDCDTDNKNHLRNSISRLSSPIAHTDSEYFNYKNIHPVYRPNNETILNSEIDQPHQVLNNSYYQLPIFNVKPFHNNTLPSQISTYFFNSPEIENSSDSYLKTFKINSNKKNNDYEIVVAAPSTKLLLPTYQHTVFNNKTTKQSNQSEIISNTLYKFNNQGNIIGKNNEKLLVPTRPNNLPPGVPYAPLPGFESQIKTGEVLDNVATNIDCNGKTNIDATLQVSGSTRDVPVPGNNYLPSVFFPSRPNTYPTTIYGTPVALHPPTIESIPDVPINPDIITDSVEIYPYPNNNILPSINVQPDEFIPTHNVGNIFPEIIQNYNRIRECCNNNNYATQKFLLASPGFPSLSYTTNPYECIYTIVPLSLDVCQIRFYLRYFNHGINEEDCTNGYVEIDGRRYCGCQTGLSIVTTVINAIPTIIRVYNSGYPRVKFNGFLMEVIQEFCSNEDYPNLLRHKKAINSTSIDEWKNNKLSSLNRRIERDLGYSYLKPSIPFNLDSTRFFNTGELSIIRGASIQKCQALNIVYWTLAAKETYFRHAKCILTNENRQLVPEASKFIPSNVFPVGLNTEHFGNPQPEESNYAFPGNNIPQIIFTGLPLPSPSNRNSGKGLSPLTKNCQLITVAEGIISSPGYPNFYSNNMNLCYRFLRIRNSCKLHMVILDFDLENSSGCEKDYVQFSNQNDRYCGKILTGTKTIFEFPMNNIIDVRFVTDSYGVGRGFNIGFVQISCKFS